MVTPAIKEVSGVDHPAHLREGWLLMKSLGFDPEDMTKGNEMPEATETDVDLFEKSIAELPEAVRKALVAQQRQAVEDREMAKALFDEREDSKFEAVAKSLGHLPEPSETFAKDLRALAEADPEAYARVEKTLRAAEAAIATSSLFKEVGDSGVASETSAVGQLNAIAKTMREGDAALTEADAFSKAVEANPHLYTQHLAEV